MQALFAWDCSRHFTKSPDSDDIIKHVSDLDKLIAIHAPKWPLDQINKIDLSVLRCALWELQYHPKTPAKVVIDEAVEIAKEFGTDKSSSFVNGVIGSVVNHEPDQPKPTE